MMYGIGYSPYVINTFLGARGGAAFTNTYSMLFDGVDERLSMSTPSGVASSSAFSISLWMKSASFRPSFGLFTLYTSSTDRVLCYYTTGAFRFYVSNGASTYTFSSYALSTSTWYHVVFVYDGSQGTNADRGKVYVNNSALTMSVLGTMPTTTSSTSSYTENSIGKYATDEFEGDIDEVRWYNYALSGTDVTDIYNSGTPKDDDLATPALHYWRMGDGATWGGSSWSVPDVGTNGTNTATSVNMEEADRTTDVP